MQPAAFAHLADALLLSFFY